MKRPAFQFYPADWRKDVELRSCSLAARGLWIDLLCIAHECDPYGHLTVNGKPMNAAQIAGQVGLTKSQCAILLQELTENGVARVTLEGAIFSKRMVDDEDLRNRRASGGIAGAEHGIKGAKSGSKGGRPPKVRGVINPPLNPPPSSSSSSSSSNNPLAPTGGRPGFEKFWIAYPKNNRKGGKEKCFEVWVAKHLEIQAVAIVAHVVAMSATKDWTKEERQYVPAPTAYLRSKAWTGAEVDEPQTTYAGAI